MFAESTVIVLANGQREGVRRRRRVRVPQRFSPFGGIWDDVKAAISGSGPSGSVSVGTGAAGAANIFGGATGGASGESSGIEGDIQGSGAGQAVIDALTLQGLRDAVSSVGQTAAKNLASNIVSDVNAVTSAKNAALQFLADNGNLFAKVAIGLGVSYSLATALMLGGGGLLLIMLLSGKKGR